MSTLVGGTGIIGQDMFCSLKNSKKLKIVSFTADKTSPQVIGTQVTLTVKATGTGTLQYKFLIRDSNGNLAILRDYTTSNTYTWETGQTGEKTLYVDVKDSNGKVTRETMSYTVVDKLAISSFTADKSSPQAVGTEVTLTTKISGGVGTIQYKYYMYLNNVYSQIKDWSTSASIKISPSTAGTYNIYVGVKDDSENIVRKNIDFEFK